jgi:hypothetical protein
MRHRPGGAIWVAWSAVVLGGLAVLVAVGLALRDPCLGDGGDPDVLEACVSETLLSTVTALTVGGTALAVAGGLGATVLTMRNLRGSPSARGTAR